CLSEDWCEYESDGSTATLEDERGAMASHQIAFPDKHTDIHRIVADDELVACHCTITATHTGPYLGLEPTGKQVVLHEMMFNRVRDGRLCETWAIVEGAGF